MLSTGKVKGQNLGFNVGYASEIFPTIGNAFNNPFEKMAKQGDLTGFYAGVNYNLRLSKFFGLSFGVQGCYYTREFETTVIYVPTEVKETMVTVDVPVLLNLGVDFSENARIALFAGPLVSFGVMGSTTMSNNLSSTDVELPWWGEANGFKRLNPQATAGIALTIQHFRIYGGYSIGILDIDMNENTKTTTSNVYMGLSFVL